MPGDSVCTIPPICLDIIFRRSAACAGTSGCWHGIGTKRTLGAEHKRALGAAWVAVEGDGNGA